MNFSIIKPGMFIFLVNLLVNVNTVYSADETRAVKYQLISSKDKDCVEKTIKISTDNFHFAYIAGNPSGMSAVFDRKRDIPYKEIKVDSLVISPDGQRFAYIARQWDKWFVIADGKTNLLGNFNDIYPESLTFSPDSRHLAYAVREMNKSYVVIDGRENKSFGQIKPESLAFSPDNKHLAYIAENFNKWFVVVDGQIGKEYDYFPNWSKIVWSSPDTFSFLLIDIHNDVYVVNESLK